MRVVQFPHPQGPLELVEREIPEPGAGSVRIRVEACGICHSDSLTKEGLWPGLQYPRVPGHEVPGVIDAVGPGVAGWQTGQRVGVGWHGGHCGLGHLGVQFAAKMGFKTVAIARGQDKEPLARRLGAWHYIDSQTQDAAAELTRLGGARVILATVTSGKAMRAVVGGLGVNGKLIVLGAAGDPLEVPPLLLIGARRSIVGWPSGTSIDSQDTLSFSALTGVRSMNEIFPLERATEAYERMMSGKARFRVVLTTGQQTA
jgi:D-arabinose 1-dehydrogenase-like Zn-dependent alcohol dehydrogenase